MATGHQVKAMLRCGFRTVNV